MAIAKMKLITISAEKEHLLDVLQKFIDLDYFHPEPASKFIDSVHGLSSMDEENPVAELPLSGNLFRHGIGSIGSR